MTGLICPRCGAKLLYPITFIDESNKRKISHLECNKCYKQVNVDLDFTYNDFRKLVEAQEGEIKLYGSNSIRQ